MPSKALVVALGALACLVLLPAAYVGVADGGAPPRALDGGGRSHEPRLESWTLVSAGPRDAGGWMCDESTPCDPQRLREREARGHRCAWSGTLWLSAGWSHPVVLLEPSLTVFALASGGDGAVREGVLNETRAMTEHWMPWQGGDAWWREEEERVRVTVPVPCDVRALSLTLNVEGRTLRGDVERTAQGVTLQILPEPSR